MIADPVTLSLATLVAFVAGGFAGTLTMTLARAAALSSYQERHEAARSLILSRRDAAAQAGAHATVAFCDRLLDALDGVPSHG